MKSIVWVPSISSQGSEFDAIIPRLKEKGYKNFIFKTPKENISFEELFTQLNRTVLSAQKDRVSLVAYSWGAYLALTYLALNPDHVERVFLINPILHDPSPPSKWRYYLQTLPWIGKLFFSPTVHYRHMVNEFPLSEDLKSCPVTIQAVFGNKDAMANTKSQLPYLQNLLKFNYKIIDNAGHSLPWTHSEVIVKEFLECGNLLPLSQASTCRCP